MILNNKSVQNEFIKKLEDIENKFFGGNLIYSFIYGSFAKQKLKKESDVDLMIALKDKNEDFNKFYEIYSKLCLEYSITLDQEYPYEVFTEKELESFFQKENISSDKKFLEDKEEALFIFIDKHSFVTGSEESYRIDCEKLSSLLSRKESDGYDKFEMRRYVKEFILSDLLNKDILSQTHQRYYRNLLIDMNKDYEELKHPHYILKKEKSVFEENKKTETKELKWDIEANTIYFSSENIRDDLHFLKNINFSELIENLPPITSTNAFLEVSKKFRMLIHNNKTFIICELENPSIYFSNMFKIKEVVDNLDEFNVSPHFTLLNENKKSFLITPYNGKTLEDCIKEKSIDDDEKGRIIHNLSILNKELYRNEYIFGGFAPRNILLSNDKIFIIDFEKLYNLNEITNEKTLYIQDFQKIWFSDILNENEIHQVFSSNRNYEVENHEIVESDYIEEAYFNSKRITQKERATLLEFTKKLERSIIYKDSIIYGHSIGQFLSDNFSPKLEADITEQLFKLDNKNTEHFKELMYLFDFLIDFSNENSFRSIYNESVDYDLQSLIILSLNKLKTDPKSIISYVKSLQESNQFSKELNFKDRLKTISLLERNLSISFHLST
ncbi:MAG: nucleotidyltransferase domain-containing protein [archaeon]